MAVHLNATQPYQDLVQKNEELQNKNAELESKVGRCENFIALQEREIVALKEDNKELKGLLIKLHEDNNYLKKQLSDITLLCTSVLERNDQQTKQLGEYAKRTNELDILYRRTIREQEEVNKKNEELIKINDKCQERIDEILGKAIKAEQSASEKSSCCWPFNLIFG